MPNLVYKARPSDNGKRLCKGCGNVVPSGEGCLNCRPGKKIPGGYWERQPNRWKMLTKTERAYLA